MLKLYSTHFYPELLELESVSAFLFPLQGYSDHVLPCYDFDTVADLVDLSRSYGKKSYAWFNRFFFDDELAFFKKGLKKAADLGFDGIAYMDFGVLKIMEELAIHLEKIYISDSSITNSQDYRIVEKFNDLVLLSRELTMEELVEIGQKYPKTSLVSVYGHQLMSISRRPLLSAYGDFVGIELKRNHVYRLQEQKRQEPYYLFEDETSASIFDGRVLVDFEGLVAFRKVGMSHFLVEGFNRSKEELLTVIHLFEGLNKGQLTFPLARQQFAKDFPKVQVGEGLRKTKTSDRKVTL